MLSILGMYNYDNTIFDGMILPLGEDMNPLIDKDILVDTICAQNAELGLIYSEPSTLKALIKTWSGASQYSWKKLAETMYLEYNPIWNKDGKITEHEEGGSDSTTEESVSAFNSSTYEPRSKAEGGVDSERDYERIEQGNIGVTSTQQLITEERAVAEFNIYDRISEDFRNRFCVMVY